MRTSVLASEQLHRLIAASGSPAPRAGSPPALHSSCAQAATASPSYPSPEELEAAIDVLATCVLIAAAEQALAQ